MECAFEILFGLARLKVLSSGLIITQHSGPHISQEGHMEPCLFEFYQLFSQMVLLTMFY